jgi:hypothetical protein
LLLGCLFVEEAWCVQVVLYYSSWLVACSFGTVVHIERGRSADTVATSLTLTLQYEPQQSVIQLYT